MILDAFSLLGKAALVTGAGKGLGQAMSVGLAEAGADIAGLDQISCQETRQMIEALGRRFIEIQCDLLEADQAKLVGVVREIVDYFGKLDILVNNAGIVRRSPILEFNEKDWDDVIQVNLKAVFFLAQAAAVQMHTQKGGKIINIASMLSFQGGILVPSYAAAKSGVVGITRSLANELAAKNINVNAIAPGYIDTDNTAAIRADEKRNLQILDRIPARRWGRPSDLKGAVVFLASSASEYMHGAVIPVDGGWLSR